MYNNNHLYKHSSVMLGYVRLSGTCIDTSQLKRAHTNTEHNNSNNIDLPCFKLSYSKRDFLLKQKWSEFARAELSEKNSFYSFHSDPITLVRSLAGDLPV